MALADQLAQGIQFAPPPDPFAQYGKMQQLQAGQTQNALAQYQLGAAQRADEVNTNFLRGIQSAGTDEGAIRQAYMGAGKIKEYQDLLKSQAEAAKLQEETKNFGVTRQKTQSDIEAADLTKKLKTAEIAGSILNGVTDQASYDQAKRALSHIVSSESLADYPAAYDPKFIASEKAAGQTYTQAQTAANAARLAATGERNATSSERAATTGEGNLAFQKQKFAWEKANPGHELIQNADGEYYAVDKRTKALTPLMVGGAAPAATAPAAGVGVPAVAPAGGVPVGRTAPAAGVPFVGKTSGMTESQGNATAFGMRMKDSHAALKDLENKGMTNTGVIGSTIGGVVGLVPLIGDKLASGVDNIYNVLPQVLGGYSPEQQQVLNGRINFITAVLRKESGASINPNEFITMEKLYFPRPGDDASLIKQKQNARELAIKAMKVQAGPGAKSIDQLGVGGAGTPSANDPLGLR
jgi:hypothetical protein